MPRLALIYSEDTDFCSVLAEQLQRQLQLESRQVTSEADVKQYITEETLLVCDGLPLPEGMGGDTLHVGQKPVRLQELLAEAALFMHKASSPDIWYLPGGVQLVVRHKQLSHVPSGRMADVTDKELHLLVALARAGTEGVVRESLLKEVWGFDEGVDTHTLETHIYRLRGKIKDVSGIDGIIEAFDGGYRMTGNA